MKTFVVKFITLRLFLTLLAIAASPTYAEKISYPIKVGVRPESITKGFSGKYYVTVMNQKGVKGDGEVVVIDKKGQVKPFAKGFDEPKGIAYVGKYLYISDLTRVWKIDKRGKATIFADEQSFPEAPLYLNDVAAAKSKKGIYVTDMGAVKLMRDENGKLWPLNSKNAKIMPAKGRVYFIDTKGTVTLVQGASPYMLNPNGVGVDNNGEIMVGAFFLGNALVKKGKQLSPLKGRFRGADAIEQDKSGNYYLSSWTQGKVWKIDGQSEEATLLAEGFKSAADFYLDEKNKRILLPDMLAGTVNEIKLR